MIALACISFIFLVPIIFLFNLQISKLEKKAYDIDYKYKRMWQFALADIFIYAIFFIIIVFILPYFIWNLGGKTYQPEDECVNTVAMEPISVANNKIYLTENSDSNKKEYIVNVGGVPQQYDSESTTIDYDNNYINDCHIEEIYEYNVYELKGYNLISSSVNDIYANIYLNDPPKTLIRKKFVICIPKNAIAR